MFRIFFRSLTTSVLFLTMLSIGQAQVVSAEYFFDTDPGLGKATSFTIPVEQYLDGEFTFDIDGLAVGRHLLGVRIKEGNVWSFTQTTEFFIEPTTIDESNRGFIKGEYFIDSDPGVGMATEIIVTAATSVDQELDIDLTELSVGNHLLGIRYQNAEGIWGHAETVDFVVEPEAGLINDYLTKWNYEISQGGNLVKSGIIEVPGQPGSVDMDLAMETSGLTEGRYRLALYVEAENGMRSFYQTATFFVINGNAPTAISLSNSEVAEKQVIGTLVGELSSIDADSEESHLYELVAGEGDSDNDAFQISGNQLVSNEIFDFNSKSSYSIRVKTTDLGELSFEQAFEITIIDLKDDQSINFTSITADTYGQIQTLSATATSGLAVTFKSSDQSIAEVDGAELKLVGVGEVTITAMQEGDDSYESAQNTQQITVGKAPLLISVNSEDKEYGEPNPTFSLNYEGFVLGETASDIVAPEVSTLATQASPAGTYEVALTGGTSDNYEYSLQTGTLTINKADLSIMADDKYKVYGEPNPSLSISYQGFKLQDDETDITAPTVSTNATNESGAGTYAIELTGGTADNYELVLTNGTITVTKATLMVSADDVTRNKGEANPSFSITYEGFKNNDGENDLDTPPQASTTATASSDRGTYEIVLSGGSDDNYEFNLMNGTLTVTGPVYTLPSSLEFPDTDVDATSELTFSITNTGDGTLEVSAIQTPDGFSADQTSLSVAAGATEELIISFTPTDDQEYNGSLTLSTNDGDLSVQLTGLGLLVTSLENDEFGAVDVKLYPNPTRGVITIDIIKASVTNYDLLITDINGVELLKKQKLYQRQTLVNLTGYQPGMYLLVVESDQGTVTKKIFVRDH